MSDEQIDKTYWSATAVLLALGLTMWPPGVALALGLTLVQAAHWGWREGGTTCFPVQVRLGYALMLVAGHWPPLRALHVIQLVGVTVAVTLDYCLLARLMSLLPWNRRERLTAGLIARRLLSRPVRGSVLDQGG